MCCPLASTSKICPMRSHEERWSASSRHVERLSTFICCSFRRPELGFNSNRCVAHEPAFRALRSISVLCSLCCQSAQADRAIGKYDRKVSAPDLHESVLITLDAGGVESTAARGASASKTLGAPAARVKLEQRRSCYMHSALRPDCRCDRRRNLQLVLVFRASSVSATRVGQSVRGGVRA